MRKLIILLSLFVTLISKAQTIDFNNYKPLQSSGDLPKEFSTTSTEKYEAKKPEIEKVKSKLEKEAKDEYYLENAFGLDDILKSGRVLFNDTIGSYLTSVMHKILENRETKKNVRVYCVKSAVVNAYTTGDGIVFVTTGLLACLRNEAQLAFILSHEYMHYAYKHSIKGYIESKKIGKGLGDYRELSLEKKLLARKSFSREQESEADLKGFELYAKSEYSLDDVDSSFEVTKYGYLPFGMFPLKRTFVESGSFKIPDSYLLTELAPVDAKAYEDAVNGKVKSGKDDEDDTEEKTDDDEDKESTHPSMEKRIDDLHDAMTEVNKKGRKHFIISEETFFLIRKIARFEIVRLNLLNQNYERAFYNAYNLLQEDPNSKYLKKSIAKALYGITMYANTGNLAMIHVKKKYAQGEWGQVPYLVGKLKGEGVSVWAINYIWNTKKEFPDDLELKLIFDDLMKSFTKTYVKKKKDFIMQYEDTAGVTTRNKKLKPFIRVGLVDLFVNGTDFKKAYDDAYKKYVKEAKKTDDEEIEEMPVVSKSKSKTKASKDNGDEEDDAVEAAKDDISIHWDEKLVKGNTKYIGDGKVLLLTPRFYDWDVKNGDGYYNYLASEKDKIGMISTLDNLLPKVMSSSEIITDPVSDEVKKLNEIALLNDWVSEKMDNGKLTMVAIDYENVQEIVKKHEVENLILFNVSNVRDENKMGSVFGKVIIAALLFPVAPIIIYNAVKEHYVANLYYITFNFKQDKIINTTHKRLNMNASQTLLKSQVYAYLINLKGK